MAFLDYKWRVRSFEVFFIKKRVCDLMFRVIFDFDFFYKGYAIIHFKLEKCAYVF